MKAAALRLVVSGNVQGVYYRAWTESAALELGLSGWVRNLPSGQVEIFAEGDPERLRELAAKCRRGPERAQVSGVEEHPAEARGEFREFTILS